MNASCVGPSTLLNCHLTQLGYSRRYATRISMGKRKYYYVGPSEVREAAKSQPPGTRIATLDDLQEWFASAQTDRASDGSCVATFTISPDGELILAPRRSEHVACASGGPVLSAGEIGFDDELTVTEISNQSTGFCPEPESWLAVAQALDRIGVQHPARFTTEVVFRLCPGCVERNVVKDDWYYCTMCNAELPQDWNFSRNTNAGEPSDGPESPTGRFPNG